MDTVRPKLSPQRGVSSPPPASCAPGKAEGSASNPAGTERAGDASLEDRAPWSTAHGRRSPFTFAELEVEHPALRALRVQFKTHFTPTRISRDCHGDAVTLEPGTRRAFGYVAIVKPYHFEFRLYPFYERIDTSFSPGGRCANRFAHELGTNMYEFVQEQGGFELALPGERGQRMRAELGRMILAVNGPQTNMTRPNGFLITHPQPGTDGPPQLVTRGQGSRGLDQVDYRELDGEYEAIEFAPKLRVRRLRICQRRLTDDDCPDLAMASPIIVEHGQVRRPSEIAWRSGETRLNEVNWPPESTYTSFTAFGVTDQEQLVVASIFEGIPKCTEPRNRGMMASEMGDLLVELGCHEGVLGGGSGDVQMYLDTGVKEYLRVAQARKKTADEHGRTNHGRPRGLGAIFAVLRRRRGTSFKPR